MVSSNGATTQINRLWIMSVPPLAHSELSLPPASPEDGGRISI
jgi:hypothetical protein